MSLRLALAVIAALAAGSANAEAPKESHPAPTERLCQPQDLLGVFVQVDFHEKEDSGETALRKQFPYHYIAFYPDQRYALLAMKREIKTPAELNPLLASTEIPIGSKKYSLDPQGVLELYTGKNIRYNYRCVASLRDIDGYKKGDLILNGYVEKSHDERFELYRRWY